MDTRYAGGFPSSCRFLAPDIAFLQPARRRAGGESCTGASTSGCCYSSGEGSKLCGKSRASRPASVTGTWLAAREAWLTLEAVEDTRLAEQQG